MHFPPIRIGNRGYFHGLQHFDQSVLPLIFGRAYRARFQVIQHLAGESMLGIGSEEKEVFFLIVTAIHI